MLYEQIQRKASDSMLFLGDGDMKAILSNENQFAKCTVRPNNTKTSEFGAQKGLLHDHARRLMAHDPQSLNSLKAYRKTVIGKVEEGRGYFWQLLGVRSFVLEVR